MGELARGGGAGADVRSTAGASGTHSLTPGGGSAKTFTPDDIRATFRRIGMKPDPTLPLCDFVVPLDRRSEGGEGSTDQMSRSHEGRPPVPLRVPEEPPHVYASAK